MKRFDVFKKTLTYAVLIPITLLIAFPIYLTFITAFKSAQEAGKNFFSFPSSLYLENFRQVVNNARFFTFFTNSLLITIVSVAVISIFCPMVSYAIARNPGKKYYTFLYFYIIAGIFVPFQVIMVPLVKFATSIKIMNQFGLIIMYITFALVQGVFLFVGYMKSIPLELEEAATIDGCSIWQTFIKIIYPLIKPMTITVIILNTLWIWNDFLLPLLILNKSSSFWTMPLFQFNFKSKYTFDFTLAYASFLFSIVPMMILYIFLQRHIINGLTAGSVKA